MGNEQLLYFNLQEKPLIVRRESKEDVQFGDMRSLHFLRDKLIFRDPENEMVLNPK